MFSSIKKHDPVSESDTKGRNIPFDVVKKNILTTEEAKSVLINHTDPKFDVPCDGIILQNVEKPYLPGRNDTCLKYKDISDNTIDFYCVKGVYKHALNVSKFPDCNSVYSNKSRYGNHLSNTPQCQTSSRPGNSVQTRDVIMLDLYLEDNKTGTQSLFSPSTVSSHMNGRVVTHTDLERQHQTLNYSKRSHQSHASDTYNQLKALLDGNNTKNLNGLVYVFSVLTDSKSISSSLGVAGEQQIDGKIVEFGLSQDVFIGNNNGGRVKDGSTIILNKDLWRFIRVRRDKFRPNNMSTFMATAQTVKELVSKETLFQMLHPTLITTLSFPPFLRNDTNFLKILQEGRNEQPSASEGSISYNNTGIDDLIIAPQVSDTRVSLSTAKKKRRYA